MTYKVIIELFKDFEMTFLDFESSSVTHILNSFDQINWKQQALWGYMDQHQGEFPFFEIEQMNTGRKIGGLFIVFNPHEYYFNGHAEIYQKQQKSQLFGLLKSEVMPSFDNENLPFNIFRKALETFLHGNDIEIEQLFKVSYSSYSMH